MTSQINWYSEATGKIRVNGKALEYACFGPSPRSAPTFVLLHEGLGCVALWKDFPKRLVAETQCGVFAYSRSGYGQSDPADLPRPSNYMTLEALEVLPKVLNRISINRGILLGHSDGASIASIYAGSVKDPQVAGVIVIAPHFFAEKMGLKAIAEAKVSYSSTSLKQKLAKYHRNSDHTFWGWHDSWMHPDFKSWNISSAIDGINVPVLAIQGKNDEYGTAAQLKEIELRISSKYSSEVLENCGHAPQFEKPEQTLRSIRKFVGSLRVI